MQHPALLLNAEPEQKGSILEALDLGAGLAWSNSVGMDAERLLRLADQALYQVKHAGRNRIRFDSGP